MKQMITLLAATLFSLSLFCASSSAATLRCTVDKVEGDVVTMTCGEKAASLAVGTAVKVKTAKKQAAAIEGC